MARKVCDRTVGRPCVADPGPAIARLAREEMDALWELYAQGTVREMYSPGGPGAVLMLEAQDEAAALAAIGRLPLAAQGVIAFELTELRPFAALSLLFARRGA